MCVGEVHRMPSSTEPSRQFGKFAERDTIFVGELIGQKVIETGASCLRDLMEAGPRNGGKEHDLSSLRTLAPVDRPCKIICVGLNYRSHIAEMEQPEPKEPVIFTKPSSAVIGPDEAIAIPDMSARVDFEGESAIVISKRARNVTNGLDHVFGYTCLNDVTARDLQKKDMDWTRAKGFDTFAPIGPYVSTRAPTSVTTRLNGKVVQRAPMSDRVFGDSALVAYISSIMTLEPGDVIATGTPSGIAPLKPGDVVEVEVDSVGCLRNSVVGHQVLRNGG